MGGGQLLVNDWLDEGPGGFKGHFGVPMGRRLDDECCLLGVGNSIFSRHIQLSIIFLLNTYS